MHAETLGPQGGDSIALKKGPKTGRKRTPTPHEKICIKVIPSLQQFMETMEVSFSKRGLRPFLGTFLGPYFGPFLMLLNCHPGPGSERGGGCHCHPAASAATDVRKALSNLAPQRRRRRWAEKRERAPQKPHHLLQGHRVATTPTAGTAQSD